MRQHAGDFLVVGRARKTEYLARREITDVGGSVPVYEIAVDGSSRRIATVHGVHAAGYFVDAEVPDIEGGFFPDLPYFLHDLRPAGFLGRLVPRRHPELRLPADVTLWTGDHALAYVARHGWNLPGALIVGDDAFRLHLANLRSPPDVVRAEERAVVYPRLAEDLLGLGPPGSSAAGEQPKFLVSRSDGTALLVKFSPPVGDAVSRRIADLLVSEKVCLEVIAARGQAAARAQLYEAADRMFLEVERFDRTTGGGRRGVISLYALDAQFVGSLQAWDASTAALIRAGRLPADVAKPVHWLQLFGRLIGNTDMHPGNVSFFTTGSRPHALAPAYDMSPSLYAPVLGHLRTPPFQPPLPAPADAPLWEDVCAAARDAWTQIAQHPQVSLEFRATAAQNAATVADLQAIGKRLPRP